MFKKLMVFSLALIGVSVAAAQPVFAGTTTDATVDESKPTVTPMRREVQTNASINLMAGDLLIEGAPDIDFGTAQITAQGHSYPATSVSPMLSVLNAGQDTDWAVQLKVGAFSNATQTLKGATRELKGASLSLTDTQVTASGGVVSQAPTGADVTIAADGSAKNILVADRDKLDTTQYSTLGVGIWFSEFGASLNVPAGNVQGDYKADLTWTLSNAPQ